MRPHWWSTSSTRLWWMPCWRPRLCHGVGSWCCMGPAKHMAMWYMWYIYIYHIWYTYIIIYHISYIIYHICDDVILQKSVNIICNHRSPYQALPYTCWFRPFFSPFQPFPARSIRSRRFKQPIWASPLHRMASPSRWLPEKNPAELPEVDQVMPWVWPW